MSARLIALTIAAILPSTLRSQSVATAGERGTAAPTYLERYREAVALARPSGQLADVNRLVLTRDVARLTLEHGTLYLLAPLAGRTVAAVFRGEGRFAFAPPLAAERAELRRFSGDTALDDELSEAVLFFSDSTAEQLATLAFHPGEVPADVADHAKDLINTFKGTGDGSFDSHLMRSFLNADRDGTFLARIERAHGGAVLLRYDPALSEGVQLLRTVNRAVWGSNWAVVTQFPSRQSSDTAAAWSYRDQLQVPAYRMDLSLPL